jgi:ubiquinone/menaquinone biosynthesis C-methylase UbiE
MENQNKTVYSTVEFDNWAGRADQSLIPQEEYLIKKYLTDKTKNVIEAGTGGGRIAFNIENLGFKNVWGFDFVPELIDYAKKAAVKRNSNVVFIESDAADLTQIKDNQFYYSIYLQQLICFLPKESIENALKESYRITQTGGTVLFSFLNYSGNKRNRYLSIILSALRKLRGESLSPQQLPWLVYNGKFNRAFLKKKQPVNYWFTKDEIKKLLIQTRYSISEITTSGEILNLKNKYEGMLYIVCKK